MGNRAVISCSKTKGSPAIYLHWNGGPESVIAFVGAAKMLGVRSPGYDPEYFLARLCQIIGNYFGGNMSIGIGRVGYLDDSDNGLYVVSGDFEISYRSVKGPMRFDDLSLEDQGKCMLLSSQVVEINKNIFIRS